MKKYKVIDRTNLPFRAPIYALLLMWLVLDRLSVPDWVWGSFGLFAVLVVSAWVLSFWREESTDIFKDK